MTTLPNTTDTTHTGSNVDRWGRTIMASYRQPTLALVRGEGAVVWDDEGNSYVDLVAGLAVNALGHAHPAVVAAVTRQVSKLGHVSNLVVNEPSIRLAERLVDLAGGNGKVFFANSGAEANEAAFKLARRTGRPHVIAADAAFHGRTMGALALTGQPSKRAPFEPLPAGVSFLPYGDGSALADAVGDATAAVFLEPIQGEAGVVVPPEGYLAQARTVTQAAGALLVLDEVQTGIARTGSWFAHQQSGIRPDIMTLAKGLGGGLPIGACLAFDDAADLFEPGQHGSTFGGNPIACAAALAVLDTVAADDLCGRAAQLGKRISDAVEGFDHPLVSHVRGAGLLLGIVLTSTAAAHVEAAARESGFLINAAAPDVVRLAPPLVLTDEQVAAFLTALPDLLDTAVRASEAS